MWNIRRVDSAFSVVYTVLNKIKYDLQFLNLLTYFLQVLNRMCCCFLNGFIE
jgi:hypothetical protein